MSKESQGKEYPVFAVVGHPNEGKSTVLSTLSEDDSVQISPFPGETIRCREYPVKLGSRTFFSFVDTPGFQAPGKTLAWLQQNAKEGENPLVSFITGCRDDPVFEHDCELAKPLASGAGILYIVDASRPISKSDRDEMEILRLTGLPRLAVINAKSNDPKYLDTWKAELRKTFNSIREFNGIHANYGDRMALLESMKHIEQDWCPALDQAIDAITEDWKYRISQVARILCDLLEKSLSHVAERNDFTNQSAKLLEAELNAEYRKNLESMEQSAWKDIRQLYRHRLFDASLADNSELNDTLFAEETWQAFGLDQKQLAIAAGTLGAGVGAVMDVAAHGLGFGIFTASAALLGVGTAYWKGRQLANTKIKRIPLGGSKISVGPSENPQLPFVLIDRVLLFAQFASRHSHGKREEEATVLEADSKRGPSTEFSTSTRQLCYRYSEAIRKGKERKREELRSEVEAVVAEEFRGMIG